jgi:hypothetical protein
VESGELLKKYPQAVGREVLINLVGKFPLSGQAKVFIEMAGGALHAGLKLRFELHAEN